MPYASPHVIASSTLASPPSTNGAAAACQSVEDKHASQLQHICVTLACLGNVLSAPQHAAGQVQVVCDALPCINIILGSAKQLEEAPGNLRAPRSPVGS